MSEKTNKTAHVLKLLSSSDGYVKENPLLNINFKDEIIHGRDYQEKKQSNIKFEENSTHVKEITSSQVITVNVIAELIEENILTVLERFKCCTCDECRALIASNILNSIPPQYVYVKNNSFKEVDIIKEEYRAIVLSNLLKNTINMKNNPIHG